MKNQRKNEGVTLTTLIITIVVIIILACIAIFSGFNTPERASFAKFTAEFSDSNVIAINDYVKKSTDYAINSSDKTKSQIYYEMASGKEIGEDEEPVSDGNVSELNNKLSKNLQGKEYYEITDNTTISSWSSNKFYYSPDEKYYITDEGEMFVLPGYRVEEDGEDRWWINENKYYVGKEINVDNGTSDDGNNDNTPIIYTVSFSRNGGGGVMNSVKKEKGSTFSLPENGFTAPNGKTFDYWLVNGTAKHAGDTIVIDSNITILAQWKNIDVEYEVSFESNGGSGTMASETVNAGSEYTLPSCTFIAPANKKFAGWQVGGSTKQAGDKITITGNTTITATWTNIKYTVSFASNGGSGIMSNATVNAGSEYTLPSCTFTAPSNKEFAGWQVGGSTKQAGDKVTITGNMTITAIWKSVNYTVSFLSNGGSGTMSNATVNAGSEYTLPSCTFTAPANKEFAGWQVGGSTKQAGDKITITGNTTVTATWANIKYTVSFESNGGSGTMANATVDAGSEYTLPSCTFTAPVNKKFGGWEVAGSTKQAGDKVTIIENTSIKAIWSNVSLTITGINASYEYKGSQITPDPVVKADGVTLTKGTDYTVTYGNNLNTNETGSVTVTYKGKYTGTETQDFTITPKNISSVTITLDITEYTYDGTEKKPGVTVTDGTLGGLTQDTDYTVAYSNNINVGEETATLTITGTGNYTGTKSAKFSIKSADMTVTTSHYTGTYDGKAHSATVNVTTPSTGAEIYYKVGTQLTASNYSTVGSQDVPTRTDAGNTQVFYYVVAPNYKAKSGSVNIYIEARNITVKPEDATKKYDGEALTSNVAKVTSGTLAEGHTISSITTTGSLIDVDTITNGISNITIVDSSNNDVTANYNITKATGTLTVTPDNSATFNITLNQNTYTYDGTAKQPGVTVKEGTKTLTSEDYDVVYTNNVDAGEEATVTVKGKGNYEGSSTSVNFTITKRALKLTAGNASKAYDGTALTSSEVIKTGDLAINHVLTVTTKGSQKDVGSSTNEIATYSIKSGTTDVAKNYEIETVQGTLTVTKKTVVAAAQTTVLNYIGTALKPTVTVSGAAAGETINLSIVTTPTSAIEPGAYTAKVTIGSVTNGSVNNYTLTGDTNISFSINARITFDSNGGSGTKDNVYVALNSEYTLPECTFTAPEGMIFDGWDISGTTYVVGEKVRINGNITVKATWESSVMYGLSGTWVWNDEIVVEVEQEPMSIEVNFTSNGKAYTWMRIWNDSRILPSGSVSKSYGLNYSTSKPASMNYGDIIYNYANGPMLNTGWEDEKYKTVDFGTEPQAVSKEFYDWFTANAVEQNYELSGTWEFIEKPDVIDINLSQDIKFYNSESDTYYSQICIENKSIEYKLDNDVYPNLVVDTWTTYYEINEDAGRIYYDWWGSNCISLGTEPQPVSKEFYEWFTTNATSVKYSIVDGTGTDGKHYHNDELFTGTCDGNSYIAGVLQSGCFVAGTKILMADGTTKNIEDVQVGDKVISYDRNNDEYYTTTVKQTIEKEVDVYYEIKLEDGTIIRATGNHPILTDKGFENIIGIAEEVQIIDVLNVGDKVMTIEGYKTIVCIIRCDERKKVYNLDVADDDEVESGEDDDSEDTFIVEGAVCHNHSGGSND